jgi:hypothetical protein
MKQSIELTVAMLELVGAVAQVGAASLVVKQGFPV